MKLVGSERTVVSLGFEEEEEAMASDTALWDASAAAGGRFEVGAGVAFEVVGAGESDILNGFLSGGRNF